MKYSHLAPYLSKLAKHLDESVGENTRNEIMDGVDLENIKSNDILRAHVMKQVMERMESKLDKNIAISVREKCACKPPELLKEIKEIYQNNKDIIQFVNALNHSKLIGKFELIDNVIYGQFNNGQCICNMVKDTKEKMPILWCECCKGHVKWTFEETFDFPIKVEIIDSITNGADDCRFKITLLKS